MGDVNEEGRVARVESNKHYGFNDIFNFIVRKVYPDDITDKGQNVNLRRAAKAFAVINAKLTFLKKAQDGSLSVFIQSQFAQKYLHFAVDGVLPVYMLPVKQQ